MQKNTWRQPAKIRKFSKNMHILTPWNQKIWHGRQSFWESIPEYNRIFLEGCPKLQIIKIHKTDFTETCIFLLKWRTMSGSVVSAETHYTGITHTTMSPASCSTSYFFFVGINKYRKWILRIILLQRRVLKMQKYWFQSPFFKSCTFSLPTKCKI